MGVATKHFVCVTYHSEAPTGNRCVSYFSCFVVLVEGVWALITAGHVINEIRSLLSKGVRFSQFRIHDKLAGNDFEFGIPFDFNPDEWAVIEGVPHGSDYAATALDSMYVRNLEMGRILPLGPKSMGSPPFEQYPDWLLVGIPAESFVDYGKQIQLAATLIPIEKCDIPTHTIKPPPENVAFARIITQPSIDGASINDIAGMSGGPIFGVRKVDGKLRYWVIGVQSGWYPQSRILYFCPLQPFIDAMQITIRKLINKAGNDRLQT